MKIKKLATNKNDPHCMRPWWRISFIFSFIFVLFFIDTVNAGYLTYAYAAGSEQSASEMARQHAASGSSKGRLDVNAKMYQLRISGSSTVYPFIAMVAENFSKSTGAKTPIVESVGTGGGFKAFCANSNKGSFDVVSASRRIFDSELQECERNGIKEVYEIPIGYDAIVVVKSKMNDGNGIHSLSKDTIFKALSKYTPLGVTVDENSMIYWSDIDSSLPKEKILFYGPPSTSGTREAFIELGILQRCMINLGMQTVFVNPIVIDSQCKRLRNDGAYVDVGENDNIIVKKVTLSSNALGIIGFGYFKQNEDDLSPIAINGIIPSVKTVENSAYPLSRQLYIYINKVKLKDNQTLQLFIDELLSDEAMGENGYLQTISLIPLSRERRTAIANDIFAE